MHAHFLKIFQSGIESSYISCMITIYNVSTAKEMHKNSQCLVHLQCTYKGRHKLRMMQWIM